MKRKLKKLYFNIINLFQTIVSTALVLNFSKIRTNVQFKRCWYPQNETATCMANGPSAREIIKGRRDLLIDTDILVVNNASLTDQFWELKPLYYILMDPIYFIAGFTVEHEKRQEEQKKIASEQSLKVIDTLLKVSWHLNVFLPSDKHADHFAEIIIKNPNIKVIRFNGTRISGFQRFQNYCYAHGWGIPSSRNVVIPALINLINIGYSKIYLYGVELSWTKTMDIDINTGLMYFNDTHFYSESEIRYFEKGAFNWWLKTISDVLTALEEIANYANKRNTQIINRTKGTFVDTFKYENPDNV